MKRKLKRYCPCGSGKSAKKCCFKKKLSRNQPQMSIVFNKRYNRLESKNGHFYPPFDYTNDHGSRTKEYKARIKCCLLHTKNSSFIFPEILFLEKGWIQPLHFCASMISKISETEHICTIPVDISGGITLKVNIMSDGFIKQFEDGSQLFECQLTGPHDLDDYCSGEYKTEDGDFYLRLFHHTDDQGFAGINSSKTLFTSSWNYQGTKKIKNFGFGYLTHIPQIKYENDLKTIAMSVDEKLHYHIDTFIPPKVLPHNFEELYPNDIYVPKVYRSTTSDRKKTIAFWINSELIDIKHLYFHSDPTKFYEICFPYIHRIKTPPKHKLEFDKTFSIKTNFAVPKKDYCIVGDATKIEGLAAPFEEDSSNYIAKVENCGKLTLMEFWSKNGNTDLFTQKPVTLLEIDHEMD